MVGFKPQISGVGGDRSTNQATTATLFRCFLNYNFVDCTPIELTIDIAPSFGLERPKVNPD